MEVKAVKAVTEVTLALTGEEASLLMNILNSSIQWDGTRYGELAQGIYEGLSDAGVEDPHTPLRYNANSDYLEERE